MPLRLVQQRSSYAHQTDIYNIELTAHRDKDYVVQLNIHHAVDKYLILKHLQLAFQQDPDYQESTSV